MDAVEFFKTINRLCKNQGCKECPANKIGTCLIGFSDNSVKNIEKIIPKLEQWAEDHPVKTRQSEFLKMFPNAPKCGCVLDICPRNLNTEYMPPKRCENTSCSVCKIDYWSEEVVDND